MTTQTSSVLISPDFLDVVADRIDRLREEAKLSQAELARVSGVSRRTLVSIRSGECLPRIDKLAALALALDVEVGALFPPLEVLREMV